MNAAQTIWMVGLVFGELIECRLNASGAAGKRSCVYFAVRGLEKIM
jgi:hypothetical protein